MAEHIIVFQVIDLPGENMEIPFSQIPHPMHLFHLAVSVMSFINKIQ